MVLNFSLSSTITSCFLVLRLQGQLDLTFLTLRSCNVTYVIYTTKHHVESYHPPGDEDLYFTFKVIKHQE